MKPEQILVLGYSRYMAAQYGLLKNGLFTLSQSMLSKK